MINSVASICRAVRESLRDNVLPHVHDAYARGQVGAALYALANLESQAAWSPALLGRIADAGQVAIDEACAGIRAAGLTPPVSTGSDDTDAQRQRSAVDSRICALLDWLEEQRRGHVKPGELDPVAHQLLRRVREIANEEKRSVAASMMHELSGG